jgi:hypothetical protein
LVTSPKIFGQPTHFAEAVVAPLEHHAKHLVSFDRHLKKELARKPIQSFASPHLLARRQPSGPPARRVPFYRRRSCMRDK